MSTWVDVPLEPMQTITSTWTGATATFQDGLFVFDAPAFNTSTSANGAYDIYLPKTLDLSDESVVYRLVAEIVSKSDGFIAMSSAVAYADISNPNQALKPETASTLSIDKYPVGTRATLATSVQEQRQNGGSPPDEDYRRQMVRLLSGPKPGIRLTMGVFAMGPRDVPATHLEVRFALQKMEARSPASIEWGANVAQVGTPVRLDDSPAQNTSYLPPTGGNPRMTPTPGGFSCAIDAHVTTNANSVVNVIIPLSAVPPFTFTDDRMIQITAHIHWNTRPEGSLSFVLGAVNPSLQIYPWNDTFSDTALPTTPLDRRYIPATRLVINGDPAGQPADMAVSWVLNKADWEAFIAGGNPSLLFDLIISTTMVKDSPAIAYTVTAIEVQALESTHPLPPVLHYRDPADGVFKPVGALTVRGFPYEPDYSTSRIMWGTDNLIVPNYAAAYVAPVVGTVPGLRVTPVTNGVRIQADAWQGGDIPSANIEIPLTFAALDALVVDERAIRPTCRFDVVNGGGILQHRILLANDAIPAGGSGLSFTLAANTVGNDILVKNSPSETVSRDPILNILRGANPRIIYKISYASVANIPAMDVTIRNVSIVAQTVMAPTKEVSWTSSE